MPQPKQPFDFAGGGTAAAVCDTGKGEGAAGGWMAIAAEL
jgi:hypothetical protein